MAAFLVNSLADSASPPPPGTVTLRQAVNLSNATAGPNTIAFAPGLTGTINLTQGELKITNDVKITGPGSNNLVINAGQSSRIFNSTANFEVDDLNLSNGKADSGAAVLETGGTLVMHNDTIANNHSTGTLGGAVATSVSTVDLTNDLFVGNLADLNGGAVSNLGFSTMNVNGCQFLSNSLVPVNGSAGGGGAIMNQGGTSFLNVNNSIFVGNTANSGGAILNYQGHLTGANDIFMANTAIAGGALFQQTGATGVLNNATFRYNKAQLGGAIYSNDLLTLNNSNVQFNTATIAGAGIDYKLGTLTLFGTVVANNSPDNLSNFQPW